MSVLICVKSKHGCSSGMMSWTVSTSMWCFTFLSLLPAVGVGATISTTAVGILGIHGLEATWALRPNTCENIGKLGKLHLLTPPILIGICYSRSLSATAVVLSIFKVFS